MRLCSACLIKPLGTRWHYKEKSRPGLVTWAAQLGYSVDREVINHEARK
jgi:hypothetical protein